jgi:putative endonuclease
MSEDRRQRLGALGEQLAAEHLTRLGYEILERNYRTRWGELDIVAFSPGVLAFCEVKSRRSTTNADTLQALTPRKRRQVRLMAIRWLHERRERPHAAVIRFDAIGVTFDRAGALVGIEHLEAAF